MRSHVRSRLRPNMRSREVMCEGGRYSIHPEVLQEMTGLRRRRASLQDHPFYCLEVVLKEGRDLVIKDNCGQSTSPYLC